MQQTFTMVYNYSLLENCLLHSRTLLNRSTHSTLWPPPYTGTGRSAAWQLLSGYFLCFILSTFREQLTYYCHRVLNSYFIHFEYGSINTLQHTNIAGMHCMTYLYSLIITNMYLTILWFFIHIIVLICYLVENDFSFLGFDVSYYSTLLLLNPTTPMAYQCCIKFIWIYDILFFIFVLTTGYLCHHIIMNLPAINNT